MNFQKEIRTLPRDLLLLFLGIVGAVVGMAIIATSISWLSPWPDSLEEAANIVWYGIVHDVPRKNLVWTPEPTDCEFLHAPIGEKGCHYERVVSIEKDSSGKFAVITWSKEK